MRRRFLSAWESGLLILALSLALSSCEFDRMYINPVTSDYDFNDNFAWFFHNADDFTKGANPIMETTFVESSKHFLVPAWSDSAHYAYYAEPLYSDYRLSTGESNWGNPKLVFGKNFDYSTIKEGSFFYDTYIGDIRIYGTPASPPALLHLCLRTWDETPNGVRPGRTWKVSTIVDDQGKDLTQDPDWTYYTDNTMRFEKADRFIFTPGEKRSAKELDLFGTAKEHATIIGSFSVTKDETMVVSLKLVFPNFTSVLKVVESRFGYVKLSGESGGKKGVLELSPVD